MLPSSDSFQFYFINASSRFFQFMVSTWCQHKPKCLFNYVAHLFFLNNRGLFFTMLIWLREAYGCRDLQSYFFSPGVFHLACNFFFNQNLSSILTAQAVSGLLTLSAQVFILILWLEGKMTYPSSEQVISQVKCAATLGLVTLVGFVHRLTDKVIVALTQNSEEFAVFINGARELPFVSIISSSITNVILPDLTIYFGEGDVCRAHMLWTVAIKKAALIIFPLTAISFAFSELIIVSIFSAKYVSSTAIFSAYLLLTPLRIVSFTSILIAAGRADLVRNGAIIGAVSNGLFTFVGVYFYGSIGAAYATVLSTFFVMVPYFLLKLTGIFQMSILKVLPLRYLIKLSAASFGFYLLLRFVR